MNLESAGSALGVSTATVRNWIRSGHLNTQNSGGKIKFDAGHIEEIKRKLSTGELGRLQTRANKKRSRASFIPKEYVTAEEELHTVENLVSQFVNGGYELRPFLLSVILELLQSHASKPSVRKELEWWQQGINLPLPKIEIELPQFQFDFLGLLYQSLLAEGAKARAGAYYTPPEIGRGMIAEHTKPNSMFLDPCCGTGLFLLLASEIITNPENIVGYDMDEVAVHIARINLLLKFPNHDFTPKIFCRCGLLEPSSSFDVVATNPPWGAHFSPEELTQIQHRYDTDSNESFSFFIHAGINYLKSGGALSILLPESFLNIRTHNQIRGKILKETSVHSLSNLGRVFKNVYTPVVRLDLKKAPPEPKHNIVVRTSGDDFQIQQKRLLANDNYIFDILNNDTDCKILDKIFSCAHTTLKANAEWALGIVTGDNARFITETKSNEGEPILTGKEIKRFLPVKPTRHIHFQPEKFQQVAPVRLYRAPEKLLYRFICDELVFSYDDKQMLALNSANILIPQIEGYSIKSALAFLNSRVFQFVFERKFRAFKVLRSNLESLPFPNISKTIERSIIGHVDLILDEKTDDKTKQIMRFNSPARSVDFSQSKIFPATSSPIVATRASSCREADRILGASPKCSSSERTRTGPTPSMRFRAMNASLESIRVDTANRARRQVKFFRSAQGARDRSKPNNAVSAQRGRRQTGPARRQRRSNQSPGGTARAETTD